MRDSRPKGKKAEKKTLWELLLDTMWGKLQLRRSETTTLTLEAKPTPTSDRLLPPAEPA